MNTGAEDDRRSTPTFAFSASSARAIRLAESASKQARASRTYSLIQFPPSCFLLQSLGHALIPPDEGALLPERLLQLFWRDVARNRIARQRQRRRCACGLAHCKAGAGDARGRLPVMGHRGAAAGDQQIVDALGKEHPVRQFVETA